MVITTIACAVCGVSLGVASFHYSGFGSWPSIEILSGRRVSVVLATAGLACCGVALTALREWRLPSFRNSDEVTSLLALPVVATTPNVVGADRSADASSRRDAADALLAVHGDRNERSVRSLLLGLLARKPTSRALFVAICSALPREGKTTFTIYIARVAALLQLNVVVVDCDGRRATLGKAMLSDNAAGLVQVLQDGADIEQALNCAPGAEISILRHSSDHRTQSLSDPRMIRQLFDAVGTRYDLVLLDTGPVLALAEAASLASAADHALLISRWRRTPRHAALIATRMLLHAKASVAGVVLTRVGGDH